MPYMGCLQRRWAVLRQLELRETLRDCCCSLDSLRFMLPVDAAGGDDRCAPVWPTTHGSAPCIQLSSVCSTSMVRQDAERPLTSSRCVMQVLSRQGSLPQCLGCLGGGGLWMGRMPQLQAGGLAGRLGQ